MTDDREQRATRFQVLVQEVAGLLPGGWICDPSRNEPEYWLALYLSGGEHLSLHHIKDRILITGCFSGNYAPRNEKHSISVSADREPSAIAADISRRLFPTYLPAYAAARQQEQADKTAAARDQALATKLAAICGEISGHDPTRFYSLGGKVWIEGNVCGGEIGLKIRGLSVEIAEAILTSIIFIQPVAR